MGWVTNHARDAAKTLRDALDASLVPARLRARHRSLTPSHRDRLVHTLTRMYFHTTEPSQLDSEAAADLHEHLCGRLERDRQTVVPWLDSLVRLEGSKVLEIGCGTGASTVALTEQGADVIGYDILPASLEIARERCALYSLSADLRLGNAAELPADVIARNDVAVFFACIEHMTLDERLASLSRVWNGLVAGAWLVVVDTPNRLWWHDGHTSLLPFYNWLPDDLAIHYARFSQRSSLNHLDAPVTDDKVLLLTRLGRSASYHEFELALGDLRGLEIRSMNQWLRRNPVQWLKWVTQDASYERELRRRAPLLNPAFCELQLELAVRKPTGNFD